MDKGLMRRLKEFGEKGIIEAERMRSVDTNAMALGLDGRILMESAGRAMAGMALEVPHTRVLIICGIGNNGGDGLVAARYLSRLTEVDVILPKEGMKKAESKANAALLKYCPVSLHPIACPSDVNALQSLFDKADLIIDAILGIGASGSAREPWKSCIDAANAAESFILSADLPTPGVDADMICGFHRPKVPNSRAADIGIPFAAEIFAGPGDALVLKPREKTAHKGAGGSVLVVGGGPYQGAPYLAGMAALRGGADVVHIATPNLLTCPDVIVDLLSSNPIGPEETESLCERAASSDVTVIGCGMGTESHGVACAVAAASKRAVVDADALYAPLPVTSDPVNTLYTPHAGEFQRAFGQALPEDTAGRTRVVRDCAESYTILAKGPMDVISDGRRVRLNRSGTPAMTTGGTGDVLAGLAGAFLCKIPAFDAAVLAAYVNGLAGEQVAEISGSGLIATDLLRALPVVLADLQRPT